jgi:hypothetical protein
MAKTNDAGISDLLEAALQRGSSSVQAAQQEGEQGLEAVQETVVDVHKAQHSLQAKSARMSQHVLEIGSLLPQTSVAHGGPRLVLPPLVSGTTGVACGGCWGIPPLSCNGDNSTTATPTSRGSTLSSGSGFFSPCGNGKDVSAEAALIGHAPPPAVNEFAVAWQQCGSALLGGNGGVCSSGGDGVAFRTTKLIGHSATQLPLLQQRPRPVLSLASELGITSEGQSTTASARSSSPTSTSSSWDGSADPKEVDAYVFVLTLRVAEGTQLGLSASRQAGYLCLGCVLPGGAVEAWNRQCGSSGAAEKVLQPGDRIVSVNDVAGDPEAMLAECDSKRLLRFCVVRKDP